MTALDRVMARIAGLQRRKPLSAVPLVATVFGDAIAPHGGRVWLGSLMRLLGPLEVSERLTRTAVYRLAQERWLEARACGRRSDYLLTGFGRRQFAQATRHIYSVTRPAWDRRWRLVVALPGRWSAGERKHLKRSLAWQGFGRLESGVYLHPGAGLAEALAALDTEDFPHLRARLLALVGEHPAGSVPGHEALVRAAWDLAELSRAYGAFIRSYQPLADALRGAPPPEPAFLLRTLLIHDYRRLLLRDPELPDELLPAGWRGREARELCARIYRSLAAPSEQHLRAELRTADGAHPPLAPEFAARFGGLFLGATPPTGNRARS